jgi:hypothetical protein
VADKDQFSSRNSGPNRAATPKSAAPVETRAGDWWNARKAGARLPEHVLPEDTDVILWTQAMEQRP